MSLPYFDNTSSIVDKKTQNQTSTPTETTFTKDVVFETDIIGSNYNNKIELSKSIDVNIVTTGTLKVNGANVGTSADITTLDIKTQNQTATGNITTFTGTIVKDGSSPNTILMADGNVNTTIQPDVEANKVNITNAETNITTLETKTQYQTATGNVTTFTGTIVKDGSSPNTILMADGNVNTTIQPDVEANKVSISNAETNITTLETKTQNQTAIGNVTTFTGDITSGTFIGDVSTASITNLNKDTTISLDDTNVSIIANTLYFNGLKVSTGSSGVGGQNLFFNKSIGPDANGYYELGTNLTSTGGITTQYALGAVNGTPKLLDSFITPIGFPNTTTLPQGLSKLGLFASVNAPTGNSSISYEVYYRGVDGIETFVIASSESVDINETSNITPYETSLNLAIPNTTIKSTDRIVIKLYGTQTVDNTKQLFINYEGDSNYSFYRSTFTGLESYVAAPTLPVINNSIPVFDGVSGKVIKETGLIFDASSSTLTIPVDVDITLPFGVATNVPNVLQTDGGTETFASSFGFEFLVNAEIKLTSFAVSDQQWTSASSNKDAAIYKSDGTIIGTQIMNKTNLVGGLFITELDTPITLGRGELYIFAAYKEIGDKYEIITNTYTTDIVSVQARSNASEGGLSVPLTTGGVDVAAFGGFIYSTVPTYKGLTASGSLYTGDAQNNTNVNKFGITTTGSITTVGNLDTDGDVVCVNVNNSGNTTTTGNIEAASYTQGGLELEPVFRDANNNYYSNGVGLVNIDGASNNTLFGDFAGKSLTTRYGNSVFGSLALESNTTGLSNTVFGDSALRADITGICNSIFGYYGMKFGNGEYNCVFGRLAGLYMENSNKNCIFGAESTKVGIISRNECVAIGHATNVEGTNAIAIGSNTECKINDTCVIGDATLTSISNMGTICDIGTSANKFKNGHFGGNMEAASYTQGGVVLQPVSKDVNGNYSSNGVGIVSLINSSGNTLFGDITGGKLTTGVKNTAIGSNAARDNLSGGYNTSIGADSLRLLTSGSDNVVVGYYTMERNNGSGNTVLGKNAGSVMTNSDNNVIIGAESASIQSSFSRTDCVAVGYNSNVRGINCIAIGSNADCQVADTCVIGDADITSISNMGDGICDLGTSVNKFKDGHFTGDVRTGDVTDYAVLSSTGLTTTGSISADTTLTVGGKSNLQGDLIVYNITPTTQGAVTDFDQVDMREVGTVTSSDRNVGWTFTLSENVFITQLKISQKQWASGDVNATKEMGIFRTSDEFSMVSLVLDKNTVDNGYYIGVLDIPLVLFSGVEYIVAGRALLGDYIMLNDANTFSSEISGVFGYSSVAPLTFWMPSASISSGTNIAAFGNFDYNLADDPKDIICSGVMKPAFGLTTTGSISADTTLTVGSNSNLQGDLIVYNITPTTQGSVTDFDQVDMELRLIGSNAGWSFTLSTRVFVTQLKISQKQWGSSLPAEAPTKQMAIFRVSDAVAVVSITLDQNTVENGYYVGVLDTPFLLDSLVEYRVAARAENGDYIVTDPNNTNTFPDIISGAFGYWSTSNSSFAMPTTSIGDDVASFGDFGYNLADDPKDIMCSGVMKPAFGLTTTGNVEAASYTRNGLDVVPVLVDDLNNIHLNVEGYPVLDGGYNNLAFGVTCLDSITSGFENIAVGNNTLTKINTGYRNTAVGLFSMGANAVSNFHNTTMGYNSMKWGNGDCNVCIGNSAGEDMRTSNNNVLIGCESTKDGIDVRTDCIAIGNLSNVIGTNCIAIGANSESKVNDTCVIGDANLLSISNMGVGVCDLGTTANKFKDGHFGGDVRTGDVTDFSVLSSTGLITTGSIEADTTLTVGGKSNLQGDLIVYNITPTTQGAVTDFDQVDMREVGTVTSSDRNVGWTFTLSENVFITQLKISQKQWASGDATATKEMGIFRTSDEFSMVSLVLDKNTVDNGYYIGVLDIPLVLFSGVEYMVAGRALVGDYIMLNDANTFSSEISGVFGYSSVAPLTFWMPSASISSGTNIAAFGNFDYNLANNPKDIMCSGVMKPAFGLTTAGSLQADTTLTVGGKSNLRDNLDVSAVITSTTQGAVTDFDQADMTALGSLGPSDRNAGWTFTPTSNIFITQLKISQKQWASGDVNATKEVGIFRTGDVFTMVSITLNKNTVENGYYVGVLDIPLLLFSGIEYTIGGHTILGDYYMLTDVNTFPSIITGVIGKTSYGASTFYMPDVGGIPDNVATFANFDYILADNTKDIVCSGTLKPALGLTTGGVIVCDKIEALHYTQNNIGAEITKFDGNQNFYNTTQPIDSIDTANGNTLFGFQSARLLNHGLANAAFGYHALFKLTSGNYNTGIGHSALRESNIYEHNTGVGYECLRNTQGSRNTAIGVNAGRDMRLSDDNVLIGYQCTANDLTARTKCVAIGSDSNVEGNNIIAIGRSAESKTDNTCVIGDANLLSIANMGAGTCDLGTSANKFKDGHFAGDVRTGDGVDFSVLSSTDSTLTGDTLFTSPARSNIQACVVNQLGNGSPAFTANYGWKFTPFVDIIITQIKMSVNQWLATTTTKEMAIFRVSDSVVMGIDGIISLNKNTIVDTYYIHTLANSFTLLANVEYIVAGFFEAADSAHYFAASFPTEITSVRGVRSATTGTFAMPDIDDGVDWAVYGCFDYQLPTYTTLITQGGTIVCSGNITAVGMTASDNIESASYTEGGVGGKIVKIDGSNNYYANGTGIPNISGAIDSTLLGHEAGKSIINLYGNTAIGAYAMKSLTFGHSNTAIGSKALKSDTVSCCNSVFGYKSMEDATGGFNSVFGRLSATNMLDSPFNVIIGAQSTVVGTDRRTGCIAIGYGSNVVGTDVIAIGRDVESKVDNTCVIGKATLDSISNMGAGTCDLGTSVNKFKDGHFGGNLEAASFTQGGVSGEMLKTKNTTTLYIGNGAGAAITTETNSLFIGNNAGASKTNGIFNVAIGDNSLIADTTSNFNTALGSQCMKNHVVGNSNTSVGNFVMFNSSGTSASNTVIGARSAYSIKDSSFNVFVGADSNSISDTTRNRCVGIGNSTQNVGDNSIAIGSNVETTVTNTCVIGDANITSISNMGNICDIGTSANKFKDGYFSGDVYADGDSYFGSDWKITKDTAGIYMNHLNAGVVDSTVNLVSPTSISVLTYREIWRTNLFSTVWEDGLIRVSWLNNGGYTLGITPISFSGSQDTFYSSATYQYSGTSNTVPTTLTQLDTVYQVYPGDSLASAGSLLSVNLTQSHATTREDFPSYKICLERGNNNIVMILTKYG